MQGSAHLGKMWKQPNSIKMLPSKSVNFLLRLQKNPSRLRLQYAFWGCETKVSMSVCNTGASPQWRSQRIEVTGEDEEGSSLVGQKVITSKIHQREPVQEPYESRLLARPAFKNFLKSAKELDNQSTEEATETLSSFGLQLRELSMSLECELLVMKLKLLDEDTEGIGVRVDIFKEHCLSKLSMVSHTMKIGSLPSP